MRRDDGELLGFVAAAADGRWRALTVFGAELAVAPDRDRAQDALVAAGLGALAERWWLRGPRGWEPAVILEAAPGRVTVVVGALPDTPRPVTLTGDAAAALSRRPG